MTRRGRGLYEAKRDLSRARRKVAAGPLAACRVCLRPFEGLPPGEPVPPHANARTALAMDCLGAGEPAPSARVVLKELVPGKTLSIREAVYERDGWRCAYCGARCATSPERLTLDHVVPRSQGGRGAPSNLVAACADCNHQRGDRPITAWLLLVAGEVVAHAVATVARALEGGDPALRASVLEVGRVRMEAMEGAAE